MLDHFPEFNIQRLATKVKPKAEVMLRKGHPWLFESSIIKLSKPGNAGDFVIIFDKKNNKFLALGLYDPLSPIRVKILQSGRPATINADWFSEKIATAFAKRKPLLQTNTNSYRLIHGENDGLPGLVADVYASVLVVKIYTPIWFPYLKTILPLLRAACKADTIVLRLSRSLQRMPQLTFGLQDGQVLLGELEEEAVIFREHDLLFSANVVKGHKTGYFLDHRHNRKRIGELASGKTVLDVFAYAGGFSVHALAGGAKAVTSLDISAQALEMARQNVALNFQQKKHNTIAADAFEALAELKQQNKKFDIVIVDPPSFAKKDSEIERALHSYGRLAKLAIELVLPRGILLLASCSSRITADAFFEVSLGALQASRRKFHELERSFHDVDHPIGFPEGAYLKSIFLKII